MLKEVWREIPGYEGYYEVSNYGHVKRIKPHYNSYSGRILKDRKDRYGYIEYKLSKDGNYSFKKSHRLVAQVFIPNPNNLETVNHKNGIKTDNRVENLEWMSREDNAKHSVDILRNNPKKKVKCVETNKIFYSVTDAAKYAKRSQSNITRAIYKKGISAGFHWEFV